MVDDIFSDFESLERPLYDESFEFLDQHQPFGLQVENEKMFSFKSCQTSDQQSTKYGKERKRKSSSSNARENRPENCKDRKRQRYSINLTENQPQNGKERKRKRSSMTLKENLRPMFKDDGACTQSLKMGDKYDVYLNEMRQEIIKDMKARKSARKF